MNRRFLSCHTIKALPAPVALAYFTPTGFSFLFSSFRPFPHLHLSDSTTPFHYTLTHSSIHTNVKHLRRRRRRRRKRERERERERERKKGFNFVFFFFFLSLCSPTRFLQCVDINDKLSCQSTTKTCNPKSIEASQSPEMPRRTRGVCMGSQISPAPWLFFFPFFLSSTNLIVILAPLSLRARARERERERGEREKKTKTIAYVCASINSTIRCYGTSALVSCWCRTHDLYIC